MSGPRASILELRSVWGTGGGPEKTILFGAELADRSRFDVTVCYLRDERDTVFGIDRRAKDLQIDYVEVRERHSFDPRIWTQLVALVRERSIDIIHAHDYKTNALAYFLGKATGAIPMTTSHGWTGDSLRERLVYYPLDKRLVARFPRVIAVSTDIKDELVSRGADPRRVVVMLNTIDARAFRREPGVRERVRSSLGLTSDQFVLGTVGRAEKQKRFDLLIDAFAELSRRRPSLRLVIVGDGTLRQELAKQVERLALQERCLLLGHRGDISQLHHAFDAFVQSSDYEGTPNAVLEAMAMESPIVATDAGGTREIAEPGVHGLIVPIGDRLRLIAAIEQTMNDPAGAAARAAAARTRVETVLSFEARTRRLEEIYDDMLMERQAAVPRTSRANDGAHA